MIGSLGVVNVNEVREVESTYWQFDDMDSSDDIGDWDLDDSVYQDVYYYVIGANLQDEVMEVSNMKRMSFILSLIIQLFQWID